MSILPRIHGLTVCVGYAEYLTCAAPNWLRGLESLTVVTDPHDAQTRQTLRLIGRNPSFRPINLFVTDAFTRNGAAFNKGLAMNEALSVVPWEDWILFFDIDVVPSHDWLFRFGEVLQLGYLYGAKRLQTPSLEQIGDPALPLVSDDRIGYGYFQLFHSKSPSIYVDGANGGSQGVRTLRSPLLDTHWRHAGNYDSNFLLSFGLLVRDVGFPVWHIGPQHENWFGKGRKHEFQQMMLTRRGLGIHESEKL